MEGIAMKHYSKEFKEEALKLSDEIGVKNKCRNTMQKGAGPMTA